MVQEVIHMLVTSTTSGRYALDDAAFGRDLHCGDALAISLGGRWIPGWVEHSGLLYAVEGYQKARPGYYFLGDDGGQCGLCVGMQVRLFSE